LVPCKPFLLGLSGKLYSLTVLRIWLKLS
jgi:hypothetical protein